jgi:RNA polymerase sigma factor (sigma-70 family)
MSLYGVGGSTSTQRLESHAMDDDFLVAAAQAGEEWAFSELCSRNSTRLFHMIYRVTKNCEDAEDALQDSILRTLRNIKQFDGRSSFATWLTRIGINSALMILRKRRIRLETSIDANAESETDEMWQIADRSANPEQHCVDSERSMRLKQAICGLPTTLRCVIERGQMEGHSVKEIARDMGITLPAAKSRLSRARAALRKTMV